jgi:Mrp family chromosome partitioning ATPase
LAKVLAEGLLHLDPPHSNKTMFTVDKLRKFQTLLSDVLQSRRCFSTAYDVGNSTNIKWHEGAVPTSAKEKLLRQRGCVLWFTGLSGSGKSTVACSLEHALLKESKLTALLDGDNVRHGLNKNLGFR